MERHHQPRLHHLRRRRGLSPQTEGCCCNEPACRGSPPKRQAGFVVCMLLCPEADFGVGAQALDEGFPGDSYHLASAKWVAKHYSARDWNQALEGNRHGDVFRLGALPCRIENTRRAQAARTGNACRCARRVSLYPRQSGDLRRDLARSLRGAARWRRAHALPERGEQARRRANRRLRAAHPPGGPVRGARPPRSRRRQPRRPRPLALWR